MKVFVNDVELYELTETKKNIIKNDIPSEIFEDDMKRRINHIIMHRYDQELRKLKEEWDPKLEAAGITEIPTDKDAYAELVFSQPDYKDWDAKLADKQKK